jgi:exopolysaccharide biosynthesis polyprenyl glycosylphosphotransferase
MVRRHTTAFRASLMAADFLSAAVLFIAVSIGRYGADWYVAWNRLGIDPLIAAVLYGLGWTALVGVQGMYRVRARYMLRTEVAVLIRAAAALGVAMIVFLFVAHVSDASRLLIGALLLATFVVAVDARVVLRWVLVELRRRGRMTNFVLIVGAGAAANGFADRLENAEDMGLRVLGHLRAPGENAASPSRPILGQLDEIETVLHAHVVDEVAICLPARAWNLAEPVTRLCASEGKIVRIPADGGPQVSGAYPEQFDGTTIMSLVYGPDRAVSLYAKRVLDFFGALAGLLVLSPLLAAIALYIWRVEGRPVIYRQERVGLHGRPFTLIKFRTMQRDADQKIEQLTIFNEVRGRAFKMTNDPRLTASGVFLRRTSIDELPQLWNVLRGEMSLVGPRPPLPAEVANYDVWHRRRLSMKPGITGLWQVSARNHPDFDQWVERDLEYIDRWSLWLDLKIMARTLPAVVTQQGR